MSKKSSNSNQQSDFNSYPAFIVTKNNHEIKMTKFHAILVISSPSRGKEECHGNGKNGWYGNVYQYYLSPFKPEVSRLQFKFHFTTFLFNVKDVLTGKVVANGEIKSLPARQLSDHLRKKYTSRFYRIHVWKEVEEKLSRNESAHVPSVSLDEISGFNLQDNLQPTKLINGCERI